MTKMIVNSQRQYKIARDVYQRCFDFDREVYAIADLLSRFHDGNRSKNDILELVRNPESAKTQLLAAIEKYDVEHPDEVEHFNNTEMFERLMANCHCFNDKTPATPDLSSEALKKLAHNYVLLDERHYLSQLDRSRSRVETDCSEDEARKVENWDDLVNFYRIYCSEYPDLETVIRYWSVEKVERALTLFFASYVGLEIHQDIAEYICRYNRQDLLPLYKEKRIDSKHLFLMAVCYGRVEIVRSALELWPEMIVHHLSGKFQKLDGTEREGITVREYLEDPTYFSI